IELPKTLPDALTEPLLTAAGVVTGTAAYMSPEQTRGEQADARSDVFTLGCILYEAAAGRRPFAGPNVIDMLWHIAHTEAPVLSGIDPELARIIAKCMEKDPALRYPTARGLAEDLGVRRQSRRFGTTSISKSGGSAAALLKIAIVIAIVVVGFLIFKPPARKISSIAVLPFDNVKSDPELDYISDGVT